MTIFQEHPGEISRITQPDIVSDFLDRSLRCPEEMTRAIHAQPHQIFQRTDSHLPLETVGEIRGMQSGHPRQIRQENWLAQMPVDEILHRRKWVRGHWLRALP